MPIPNAALPFIVPASSRELEFSVGGCAHSFSC
jgi:hypothetical protein